MFAACNECMRAATSLTGQEWVVSLEQYQSVGSKAYHTSPTCELNSSTVTQNCHYSLVGCLCSNLSSNAMLSQAASHAMHAEACPSLLLCVIAAYVMPGAFWDTNGYLQSTTSTTGVILQLPPSCISRSQSL
jgi:hypothetical protein